MFIHEHLPPEVKRSLKQVGWTKGVELAKLARSKEGQDFDCATWLHKARSSPISGFFQFLSLEQRKQSTELVARRQSRSSCSGSSRNENISKRVPKASRRSAATRRATVSVLRLHKEPRNAPSTVPKSFRRGQETAWECRAVEQKSIVTTGDAMRACAYRA